MAQRIKLLLVSLLFAILAFPALAGNYDFVVALDGSGNFTSIQKAIDASKAFPESRVRIFVKNGTYKEKLVVPSCNSHLSIIGESADKTIISYDDYFDKISRGRNSTFYTYTLKVEANDFHLKNITVENTAGLVGQAVALHVEGDRCVFINCRFLGNQDTVYAAGKFSRQFFLNCYVEGTTDFIFGEATALFESCALHCKANSFITAASTPEGKPFGFVFLKCKITAASRVNKVYLGRPWRSFAKVAFLNCEMGSFIAPEGWDNWSKAENEETAVFAEYSNSGEGAERSKRVGWSLNLNKNEALKYTKENIFAPLGWEISQEQKWFDISNLNLQ
ncbi:MAG: pectinesterase family protein [Bacteroidota bacterium]|nr:pectinesterase family protein [Bacteroidota bacterium]